MSYGARMFGSSVNGRSQSAKARIGNGAPGPSVYETASYCPSTVTLPFYIGGVPEDRPWLAASTTRFAYIVAPHANPALWLHSYTWGSDVTVDYGPWSNTEFKISFGLLRGYLCPSGYLDWQNAGASGPPAMTRPASTYFLRRGRWWLDFSFDFHGDVTSTNELSIFVPGYATRIFTFAAGAGTEVRTTEYTLTPQCTHVRPYWHFTTQPGKVAVTPVGLVTGFEMEIVGTWLG